LEACREPFTPAPPRSAQRPSGLFALVALVHLADNYHVDHVAGAWMGLSAYAGDGILYPPLSADGFYGGTRYAPLGIALNTVSGKVTGEQLVAGKVLALLVMSGLLVLAYTLVRSAGSGRAVSLLALGAIIASQPAQFAGTTIYGDALAVTLQLAAVAIVALGVDRRAVVVAGILAGLAVTAKFSGLWGGATVVLWLLLHERRRLLDFLAAAAATVLAGFGLAALASHGRIGENVVGLGGSGFEGLGDLLVETPRKVWDLLLHNAEATLVVLPFAAGVIAWSVARRRTDILHVALLLAALQTLVVMADVGTGFNHLLDVAVLAPLVVAGAYARADTRPLGVVLIAALGLGTAVSLWNLRHDVREAATTVVHLETPERLKTPALDLRLTEPYFTEDPTIAVQRGQRPVALDSFMLLRVVREHQDVRRELIARFERKEFTAVVLLMDLDLGDAWWSDSHLGLDVARAIERNYVFVRKVRGPVFKYRLLEPRGS